jgi:VWFA-related protein
MKGRPVKDLTIDDFEVLEDGARQKIESFRLVSRDTPARPAATDKPAAAASADFRSTDETNPNLVAIVFDRLSPDARNLARKASGTYATEGFGAGDFTGVFVIDLSLKTLQNYTDNPELIRKALDDATAMGTSQFASNNQQTRSISERVTGLNRQVDAGAGAAASAGAGRDSAGASAAGEAIGVAASQAALLQMQERMLATFEMLERDQQGYATINGLLAVITSMRNLPGRKTIISFGGSCCHLRSGEVSIGDHAANRAGVSIYSIDSAGLRVIVDR